MSAEPGLPPVGTRLRSRARTVTEADVTMFSALTGDWHPQHCDAVWARSSLFGERVAHGLLVLSFALGLVELDHDQVLLLRRLRGVVFKRPTRIGDTIHVRALVESIRPVDGSCALLGLRWSVVNSRQETILRAQVEVLCRLHSDGRTPRADANEDTSIPGVYPF